MQWLLTSLVELIVGLLVEAFRPGLERAPIWARIGAVTVVILLSLIGAMALIVIGGVARRMLAG